MKKSKLTITQEKIKILVYECDLYKLYSREIFEKICKEKHIELLLSDKAVATDNAIMIAAAGYISYLKNKDQETNFKAEGNLKL